MSNLVSLEYLTKRFFRDDPVPAQKLQRWCRDGALPAQKIGRDWRVDLEKFDGKSDVDAANDPDYQA